MRDTAACRVGLRPGPHLWSSSYPPFCLPPCFLKSCQSILLRTPSFFAFPGALPFLRTIPVCIDCSQESPTLIGPQHLPAAPGSHSPPRRQCPALPRAPAPFTRTLGSPRGLTEARPAPRSPAQPAPHPISLRPSRAPRRPSSAGSSSSSSSDAGYLRAWAQFSGQAVWGALVSTPTAGGFRPRCNSFKHYLRAFCPPAPPSAGLASLSFPSDRRKTIRLSV